MREIRMLRAMWLALVTESQTFLNGREGGNAGHSQGTSYGFTRQRSTLPGSNEQQRTGEAGDYTVIDFLHRTGSKRGFTDVLKSS